MSLEEWLGLLRKHPRRATFIDYEFPTNKHRSKYLRTIVDRSEEEVVELLRHFLLPCGSLGTDKYHLKWFLASKNDAPEMYERMSRNEYTRRLVYWAASGGKTPPPWEGITWILDLLPHFPKSALEGLEAYIFAHIQMLPDGRLQGLSEAAELIRAKYIGMPGSHSEAISLLLDLSPRHFECLVERMYKEMGYKTQLTPAKSDGGRDVLAWRRTPGRHEQLLVECKRHARPVGVAHARAILGVVSHEKVNKGVIAATSKFTKAARNLARSNPRLELIGGQELVLLFNEFLGPTWPLHIEHLVVESMREGER